MELMIFHRDPYTQEEKEEYESICKEFFSETPAGIGSRRLTELEAVTFQDVIGRVDCDGYDEEILEDLLLFHRTGKLDHVDDNGIIITRQLYQEFIGMMRSRLQDCVGIPYLIDELTGKSVDVVSILNSGVEDAFTYVRLFNIDLINKDLEVDGVMDKEMLNRFLRFIQRGMKDDLIMYAQAIYYYDLQTEFMFDSYEFVYKGKTYKWRRFLGSSADDVFDYSPVYDDVDLGDSMVIPQRPVISYLFGTPQNVGCRVKQEIVDCPTHGDCKAISYSNIKDKDSVMVPIVRCRGSFGSGRAMWASVCAEIVANYYTSYDGLRKYVDYNYGEYYIFMEEYNRVKGRLNPFFLIAQFMDFKQICQLKYSSKRLYQLYRHRRRFESYSSEKEVVDVRPWEGSTVSPVVEGSIKYTGKKFWCDVHNDFNCSHTSSSISNRYFNASNIDANEMSFLLNCIACLSADELALLKQMVSGRPFYSVFSIVCMYLRSLDRFQELDNFMWKNNKYIRYGIVLSMVSANSVIVDKISKIFRFDQRVYIELLCNFDIRKKGIRIVDRLYDRLIVPRILGRNVPLRDMEDLFVTDRPVKLIKKRAKTTKRKKNCKPRLKVKC